MMDTSSLNSSRKNKSGVCMCFQVCRMVCWKAFKWIPVLLITSIVIWSYYAYVIQLCIFTLTNTVQQCVYLILFHIILFMFVWSYARTIFAEIKPVPDRFKLPETEIEKLLSAETEDDQRNILENFAKELPVVTRTTSGSVRYCNRCVLIKPDRAHHCSICARCVLKMDHHCPWVNNCVCYFNYKFFLLFLGYALSYCLFITLTCLPYFVKFWREVLFGYSYEFLKVHDKAIRARIADNFDVVGIRKGDMMNGNASAGRYHIVFAFFVALMFAISLGSLFGYHCYLIAKNRTTLEMLSIYGNKGKQAQKMVNSIMNLMISGNFDTGAENNHFHEAFRAPMFRGGADRNGFSIGCFNNFKEVFGNRPNLWLLPIFSSMGDGCTYPVRREHELQAFTAPAPPEPHGYESMGTTRSSFGDGVVYPLPAQDEDTESLLSSERWDRWGERARPFDERESSSYDEL